MRKAWRSRHASSFSARSPPGVRPGHQARRGLLCFVLQSSAVLIEGGFLTEKASAVDGATRLARALAHAIGVGSKVSGPGNQEAARHCWPDYRKEIKSSPTILLFQMPN